jgi:transposase
MGHSAASGATESWEQLALRMTWSEQRSYEIIRPVVLYGDSAADRAQATGEPIRTIYRHLQRFTTEGFAGLTAAAHPPPPRTLPPPVRDLIRSLKGEYPSMTPNEIARICQVKLSYRPGARTIKRVLTESPPAAPPRRRFPLFHAMTATARRRAVIRLHLDGWGKKSIAAYLQTSRKAVHAILRRFASEDLAALHPRSHAPKKRVRKVTLKIMQRVWELQKNPGLGAFRLHAALKQEGIRLSPSTVGRIAAANRAAHRTTTEARPPREKRAMPFKAVRPHQYWSIDLRYLDMHTLGGGMIYCLTILDNYSRAVLASVVSRAQDLTTYLLILFLAIRNHGAPEAIVTDGGGIFRANKAKEIYRDLQIHKDQIEPQQAWQNYIETMFNVQRRMADYHFAQATTWEALLDAHTAWVADYNYQEHWAHQKRPDQRRSPFQVLAWVRGRPYQESDLHYVFYSTRFQRHLNRYGYLRFRNWRVYAEEGLAGDKVIVWLYQEHMTIAFKDTVLGLTYQPDQIHPATVTTDRLYPTPYQARQLTLWPRTDPMWRLTYRLPLYPVYRRVMSTVQTIQLTFPLDPNPGAEERRNAS